MALARWIIEDLPVNPGGIDYFLKPDFPLLIWTTFPKPAG